jgi:carboxypeptidase C (cathepsin A)
MNMRLFLLFPLLAAAISLAQTTGPTTKPGETKLSTTHHEITLNGKTLSYTATAGPLAMQDETGKPQADLFYVAYDADNTTDPATRPITFLFNGGPGAAAVWLHLGAAGPKTIELDDQDLPVGPPYHLTDNSSTWLTASDLVFIDPVSTGYSRPAPGEKADQFHGVNNDIESVSAFIRLYLTKHRRWASPIYLAGESYGTTRAAALANQLAQRYGINVNGVILISSVLDFQALMANPGNDLPFVLYLPSYAAIAFHHKLLSPDLQADFDKTIDQARAFALNQYAPALAQGAALPADQRTQIIKQLSSFTSLPADLIDRANLRIDPAMFEKKLLDNGRHIIGRFDARIIGIDPDPIRNAPAYDPSLNRYLPAYSATFNDYIRRELNYENDLPYEVLTDHVQPWPFGEENGGYLYVVDDLQSAILHNPHLRVMFVSGYFDLATPFFSADYVINRMNLDPTLRPNITHEYFPTGHMVYHDHDSKQKLADDVAKFIHPQ